MTDEIIIDDRTYIIPPKFTMGMMIDIEENYLEKDKSFDDLFSDSFSNKRALAIVASAMLKLPIEKIFNLSVREFTDLSVIISKRLEQSFNLPNKPQREKTDRKN